MSEKLLPVTNLETQKAEGFTNSEVNSWESKWKEIKERQWDTDLGLLVISGKPGAGTSTAARILAYLYEAKLYKAGDTIRELAGATDRTKAVIRDPEVDHIVDGEVRKMTMDATKGQPAIAEAQIGAVTAHEVIQGTHPKAPILRMLFWATKEERVRRLYDASREEVRKKSERFTEVIQDGTDEEIIKELGDELDTRIKDIRSITDTDQRESMEALFGERAKIFEEGTDDQKRELLRDLQGELQYKTLRQIYEETTEREHDDQEYWKKLYPALIGKDNPLEKGALDANGNEIYNTPVFDNTEWGTPERSAYEVHKFLSEMGMVRPKVELQRDQSVFLGYQPEDNLFSDS